MAKITLHRIDPEVLKIMNIVSHISEIPVDVITGRKRLREIVSARRIAMFLLHDIGRWSTTEIGASFNRDHATVIHAVKTHYDLYKYDRSYKMLFDICKAAIEENGGFNMKNKDDVIAKLTDKISRLEAELDAKSRQLREILFT